MVLIDSLLTTMEMDDYFDSMIKQYGKTDPEQDKRSRALRELNGERSPWRPSPFLPKRTTLVVGFSMLLLLSMYWWPQWLWQWIDIHFWWIFLTLTMLFFGAWALILRKL